MSSPRESRNMGGVGSYEPTLVRAVKTPGPKWDRKHRGKDREEREEAWRLVRLT